MTYILFADCLVDQSIEGDFGMATWGLLLIWNDCSSLSLSLFFWLVFAIYFS